MIIYSAFNTANYHIRNEFFYKRLIQLRVSWSDKLYSIKLLTSSLQMNTNKKDLIQQPVS